MAEAFVSFTAGGHTATFNADALLDAVVSLADPAVATVGSVRVVEGGFMVPEEVADEAGLPRYPQLECEECE